MTHLNDLRVILADENQARIPDIPGIPFILAKEKNP